MRPYAMVESNSPAGDDSVPSAEAVRMHLRRVLGSSEFAPAPQLAVFLTYIVERKLEGQEERIKAYTIATEALGRPASFDPQADPIIRVQARRLRQALSAFYAGPGAEEGIRIHLGPGSYVPEFSFDAVARIQSEDMGDQRARWRRIPAGLFVAGAALLALGIALWFWTPMLRVTWDALTGPETRAEANPVGMPALVISAVTARDTPSWFSPDHFAEGVEASLAKFDEFVVLAPSGSREFADTDYRLELSFTGGPSSVIGTARLLRGHTGEIVWSNRFTIPEDSIDAYELIDPVRRLTSTLGQPYGVLYAHMLSDTGRTAEQACLLSGYEWFQNPAKEGLEPIRECLESLVSRRPGNHVAHMMLAYIHVARYRWGVSADGEADLTVALNLAQRAVALRPQSAGSHQALMEVQWARRKFDIAEEEGRNAMTLNPNSSDVVADFGCRLIYQGKYSEGETYVERAARWNVQPPVWHQFCRFLAAYNGGRLDAAEKVADLLDGETGPEALIPGLLMAHRAGDTTRVKTLAGKLLDFDASFADDGSMSLERIGLLPELSGSLADQVRTVVRAVPG